MCFTEAHKHTYLLLRYVKHMYNIKDGRGLKLSQSEAQWFIWEAMVCPVELPVIITAALQKLNYQFKVSNTCLLQQRCWRDAKNQNIIGMYLIKKYNTMSVTYLFSHYFCLYMNVVSHSYIINEYIVHTPTITQFYNFFY